MANSNPPNKNGDPGPEPGQLSPQDRDAFKQRADALGQKLNAAKGQSTIVPKPAHPDAAAASAANSNALGKALRVSTELIGGIVVGAGLGWVLDQALGTWPAFFIVFFLVGSAAGMLNVVRAGTAMKSGPVKPNSGPSVRDDDDDDK
jgi:ATP synthase protein I